MTQLGRALCDRFEEVSRSELTRLRKKMGRLSPEDRATVEAIAVEVTQSIALRLDASLAVVQSCSVGDAVAKIFSLDESSWSLEQVESDRRNELRNRT